MNTTTITQGSVDTVIKNLINQSQKSEENRIGNLTSNEQIISERLEAFNSILGPRKGDWILIDDRMERIAYFTEKGEIQPSVSKYGSSFYMFPNGKCSFSGGLGNPIKTIKLISYGSEKEGEFWIFANNIIQPGNAHRFTIPCRVYILLV